MAGDQSRELIVRILVSEKVFTENRERLLSLAPNAEWTLLSVDGVASSDAPPDVVFISNDIFYGPVKQCMTIVENTPGLRWLQSAAAGLDAPILRTVLERGARMSRASVTAVPIAEYVLQAVLGCYQNPALFEAQRARREWKHQTFREVWRTTWMVIGLGAIGSEVAKRARAFDAHVIGVRRRPDGTEPVDEMISTGDVLTNLVRADVVVIAADLNDQNRKMVNTEFLAAMKAGSILVNVARGGHVDEPALLDALARGIPERAVLDVFETEPLPAGSPFWDHPRVVMTPHSSGGGTGRLARAVDVFCTNLPRFFAGEPLVHEVVLADLPQQAGVWHVTK